MMTRNLACISKITEIHPYLQSQPPQAPEPEMAAPTVGPTDCERVTGI